MHVGDDEIVATGALGKAQADPADVGDLDLGHGGIAGRGDRSREEILFRDDGHDQTARRVRGGQDHPADQPQADGHGRGPHHISYGFHIFEQKEKT